MSTESKIGGKPMPIKSLEELRQIKETYKDRVKLRSSPETVTDQTEILIGMATCGISAGSRETLQAFMEELSKQNLDNIKVIPVGCMGYCHSEPVVEVMIKGEKPVIYGNVKKERVHEIVESHIKGGHPVKSMILKVDFERV